MQLEEAILAYISSVTTGIGMLFLIGLAVVLVLAFGYGVVRR